MSLENNPKRKQDKVKPPPNAFMLYRSAYLKEHGRTGNGKMTSKMAADSWNTLDAATKSQYMAQALKLREEFKKAHPEFQYNLTKNLNRRLQAEAKLMQMRKGSVDSEPSTEETSQDSETDNADNDAVHALLGIRSVPSADSSSVDRYSTPPEAVPTAPNPHVTLPPLSTLTKSLERMEYLPSIASLTPPRDYKYNERQKPSTLVVDTQFQRQIRSSSVDSPSTSKPEFIDYFEANKSMFTQKLQRSMSMGPASATVYMSPLSGNSPAVQQKRMDAFTLYYRDLFKTYTEKGLHLDTKTAEDNWAKLPSDTQKKYAQLAELVESSKAIQDNKLKRKREEKQEVLVKSPLSTVRKSADLSLAMRARKSAMRWRQQNPSAQLYFCSLSPSERQVYIDEFFGAYQESWSEDSPLPTPEQHSPSQPLTQH
ncbi:hypothetical protein EDD86DRAFT_200881 [Gorgonomyces haynaldii]|nr:hypothetical protein EDD86DRAFT_200881 [Gorgonomyces haynaldii]